MASSPAAMFLGGAVGVRLEPGYCSVIIPPGQMLPLRNESLFTGKSPGQKEYLFRICFLGSGQSAANQSDIASFHLKPKTEAVLHEREFSVVTEIDMKGSFTVSVSDRTSGEISARHHIRSLPVLNEYSPFLYDMAKKRLNYLNAVNSGCHILKAGRELIASGLHADLIHFLFMSEGFLFGRNATMTDKGGLQYAS